MRQTQEPTQIQLDQGETETMNSLTNRTNDPDIFSPTDIYRLIYPNDSDNTILIKVEEDLNDYSEIGSLNVAVYWKDDIEAKDELIALLDEANTAVNDDLNVANFRLRRRDARISNLIDLHDHALEYNAQLEKDLERKTDLIDDYDEALTYELDSNRDNNEMIDSLQEENKWLSERSARYAGLVDDADKTTQRYWENYVKETAEHIDALTKVEELEEEIKGYKLEGEYLNEMIESLQRRNTHLQSDLEFSNALLEVIS